ncbi:hypothetical protein OXT66_05935 [Lentilactobacillus senioris]|uniref:hypothetical protein n=1 Tax=Lentilactobacillus senioris TaxID=931534 RepID=UPI0022813F1B|nr:hypothetical protein [Lentilactobacillus senioris]MCY9807088.1 hypothetical protein [Lentilactobacillus senioris]
MKKWGLPVAVVVSLLLVLIMIYVTINFDIGMLMFILIWLLIIGVIRVIFTPILIHIFMKIDRKKELVAKQQGDDGDEKTDRL